MRLGIGKHSERMNGSNVSFNFNLCLSHMRLWRCVQPAKLLTFAQKSTPNSQKQTANSKKTKDNDNDTGRRGRGRESGVREMKLFGDYAALKPNVLCIKCKHALPVTVASHRQRFTRTSILLTCPAAWLPSPSHPALALGLQQICCSCH